jgi:CRP/FNR family cyclic AMP-dependent transcriptional regulator
VKPGLDHGAVAAILAATPLFAGLDEPALRRLAAGCSQRTYARGQYLWYQGDPGDRLYLIVEGLVKVVLTSDEGDEMVLATLGAHQSIGELAVIDGAPRSASVITVEPTTVLMLARPRLLELLVAEHAVLDAMLRSLGGLVRRLTEQTGDLVFLDLGGRLAKLLLRLAETHVATGTPVVLDLGLSQSDLAAMVGATRPAVNRALQLFATRGLVTLDGQRIELRDVAGLRRRAGI